MCIGEEFECIGASGACRVVLSLCENTAELVLHWKDKGKRDCVIHNYDVIYYVWTMHCAEIKQTADLASVEVRKGFSHVHQHVNMTGIPSV